MPAGRAAVVALVVLAAASAQALEPRFDHRDQEGLVAEIGAARDEVSAGSGTSTSIYQPVLRVAYGFDLSGQGDELLFGGSLRFGAGSGPGTVRWVGDVRYRGYFGSEELKTFFDAGLWVPVSTRVAVGPRVGLGLAYDFGRTAGVYTALGFGTGFGQMRISSLDLGAGFQWRWP